MAVKHKKTNRNKIAYSLCGVGSGDNLVPRKASVTCKRCLKMLAEQEAKKAQKSG